MMTPDQATQAYFETMKGETDRAGLMYSQWAVVMQFHRIISEWDHISDADQHACAMRLTAWIDDFNEKFSQMDRQAAVHHKFEYAYELDAWCNAHIQDKPLLSLSPEQSAQDLDYMKSAGITFADGIYEAAEHCLKDCEQGCPVALHSPTFEIARLMGIAEVEFYGAKYAKRAAKLLEDIEKLRDA